MWHGHDTTQGLQVCGSTVKISNFALLSQIIRDGRLFCALGALLSIDVAVLAIWQLTDPLRSAGVTITVSLSVFLSFPCPGCQSCLWVRCSGSCPLTD